MNRLHALQISVLCSVVTGSLYNPHLFPQSGPFFEGWYLRITDFNNDDSIGLLFGSVLPPSSAKVTGPLVLAAILYRECSQEGTCTLTSSNANFSTIQLNITVNGQPVTHNPDKESKADFKWVVNNGNEGGSFMQSGDKTDFNFRLGEWTLRGAGGPHVPWNSDGSGPEGWLSDLPLPIHWFVYSLRSPLISYDLQNTKTGKSIHGSNGAVHLEKNWGESFPKKWIWSEGISRGDDNVTFAISGGLVGFSVISVDAYLIGYRNPSAGLSLDFRPDNSVVTAKIDGCSGAVSLTVRSLSHKVEFQIFGSPKTFSSCLFGPETKGFERACVESYDATATVVVSQMSLFGFMYKVVDKRIITNAALEFGGNNVCDYKCGKF